MSQERPLIPSFPETPRESSQTSGTPLSRLVIVLKAGAIGFVMLIVFAILGAILLAALLRPRESTGSGATCSNHLKQMGLIFKMFSAEAPNKFYPQLSPDAGQLMFSGKDVFPEYLADVWVLVCPNNRNGNDLATMERFKSDPQSVVNDKSYIYLGYVITSDDEMEAFAKVYKERVAQGLPFDTDLKAPPGCGSIGTDTFYRLREGVEREFIKDSQNSAAAAMIQSAIPVMWDRFSDEHGLGSPRFNHKSDGVNVLFMDGHVEHKQYPSKWPLTSRTLDILAELDALAPKQ